MAMDFLWKYFQICETHALIRGSISGGRQNNAVRSRPEGMHISADEMSAAGRPLSIEAPQRTRQRNTRLSPNECEFCSSNYQLSTIIGI